MEKVKFRNIGDIEKFENTPIEERMQAFNTYDLLKNGAAINPEAHGNQLFSRGRHLRPADAGILSGSDGQYHPNGQFIP